jgi:hypothetical protein
MSANATQPYQRLIPADISSPDIPAIYGYTETSMEMPRLETDIVHHGNARLTNANMPPTIPMMFGFKEFHSP